MTRRNATNFSDDVLALNPELADLAPQQQQRSRYEVALDEQLAAGGLLDGIERNYHFDDERQWNFDFAWPALLIAAEVDGGNRMARRSKRTGKWIAVGRHTQSDDYRKRNAAIAAGWRVYAFTPEMIRSGEALATLQDALVALPDALVALPFT